MKVCSVVDKRIITATAEQFHTVTQVYTNEIGTTARFKIHWREKQLVRNYEEGPVEAKEIDDFVPREVEVEEAVDDLDIPSHQK